MKTRYAQEFHTRYVFIFICITILALVLTLVATVPSTLADYLQVQINSCTGGAFSYVSQLTTQTGNPSLVVAIDCNGATTCSDGNSNNTITIAIDTLSGGPPPPGYPWSLTDPDSFVRVNYNETFSNPGQYHIKCTRTRINSGGSITVWGHVQVNGPPSITSFSATPNPVNAGNTITFTLTWSDPDPGEQAKSHFCKTNAITGDTNGGYCPGGSWADTPWNTASVNYTAQAADGPTLSYYAFVCDVGGLCSGASGNAGTVTVNRAPSITTFSASPNPVNAGQTVTFTLNWSDPDAGQNTKVHFCKTNAITGDTSGGFCPGGSWADSALDTVNPKSVTYIARAADAPIFSYYAFVCDVGGLCSGASGNAGTVAVGRPAMFPLFE